MSTPFWSARRVMVLNNGMVNGRRILSEAAVKQMTSRQTPPDLKDSYGFGFSVGGDGSCGHGGAFATNMTIDRQHGLILVWMVQNAGTPAEWRQCEGDFRQWALKNFAP